MLIDGLHLFPLNNINPRFSGYLMDSDGTIYSQKARKNKLTKLWGSTTTSGQYYTLSGNSYRADDILRQARSHKAWFSEVGNEAQRILDGIRSRNLVNTGEVVHNNEPDRSYAVSMNNAIKHRGVLIATIEGDKLLFGSKPKIHIGETSWKSEMERLARVAPGKKFVALQIVASVVAEGLRWE